jgi:D-glycero-D-manno-heptose 1,7-bisphosphate phosphatase
MRFLLIDRDGTLIVEKHYLHDPALVELFDGCAAALADARHRGWGIVCVSNQAGVGRGYFPATDVDLVNAKVEEELNKSGASIDHYYYCTDHPETPSTHRKPEPGMGLDAAKQFGFDPTESIVIGDKPCDIELAERLGCASILVRTGYGSKHEAAGDCRPDYTIDSIADLPAILEQHF